jgi:hypothetical protein
VNPQKTIREVRWGTYRRAGRVGKIDDSQAHARGKEVGGVLRLATELLPNGSLTWHELHTSVMDFWRGGCRPHGDRNEAKRCGKRKPNQMDHPLARAGSGIPFQRMPVSFAFTGQ